MRCVVVVGVAALALGLLPAASVSACTDCGPGASGTNEGDTSTVEVHNGSVVGGSPGGSATSGGGGPSHPLQCKVYLAEDAEGSGDVPTPLDPATIPAGTEVWQNCVDLVTHEVVYSGAYAWGPGQVTPSVPPRVLAQQAKAQLGLPLPSTRTWPAPDQQVVRIPTWLHVDNFAVDSRTASLGVVSATVTATPIQATWDMGNGDRVVCASGGAVFEPGASDPFEPSDCSYAFDTTSAREPTRTYEGLVTVTWHLAWTSNIGAAGDLGEVTRSTAISWRVEQIQSLITHEGKR